MENEKRLIDADVLSGKVEESKHNNPHPQGMLRVGHRNEHDHFLRMIHDAPTVDAVVLPFKVGGTVWIAGDKFPAEIERIIIDADGISFEYVEYDRGYELSEVWDDGSFKPEDIGKTVFLTQEEAERRARHESAQSEEGTPVSEMGV